MDAKLTLKLDRDVIEKAKQYASDHRVSLSRMVENYLQSLTSRKQDDLSISPFVNSLSGSVDIAADYDYRDDYTNHLDRKHE